MARRFGNWVAEGELGRGGMGVVFRARHAELGRSAAVKVLEGPRARDPEATARFFDEARAASAIRHPGIVEVFDLGRTEEGEAYYVMELLEGESLAERLARDGPLAPADAARVGTEVAEAVGAAHKAGIIHRDLKPGNVFLTSAGRVKVLDFGVAKLLAQSGASRESAPTMDGAVLGTPHYMAPEQGMGWGVDARADVYSLGAILYELLCVERPFEGDTALQVAMKHASERLVPVRERARGRGVPEPLERVVMQAMARSRNDRYEGMAELAAALRAAVGEPTTPGLDRTLPAPTPSSPGPSLLPPAAGAAAPSPAAATPAGVRPAGVAGAAASSPAAAPPTGVRPAGVAGTLATMMNTPRGGAALVVGGLALIVGWLVFLSVRGVVGPGTGTGAATASGGPATATLTAAVTAAATAVVSVPPALAPRGATASADAYAAYLRGMDFLAKFRRADAAGAFAQAVALDPDFAQAHLMMALNKLPDAVGPGEHLARAEALVLKLTPDERAQLDIARAVNRDPADYVGAARLLEARVTAHPGDVYSWYRLAETRASLLEDDGALAAMERVVALAPSFMPAHNSLAYLYERLGRPDDALREVEAYLIAIPNEPNPYDTRADILLYARRFDEAEKALGSALALAPDFVDSRAKAVLLRLHAGDVAGARALVPRTDGLSPADQLSWLDVRVGLALSAGDVAAALALLKAAVVRPAAGGSAMHALETTLKWLAFTGGGAADARAVLAAAEKLGGPRVEKLRLLFAVRWDAASWTEHAVDAYAAINAERSGETMARARRAYHLAWRSYLVGDEKALATLLADMPGSFVYDPSGLMLRGIGRLAVGSATDAERDFGRADAAAITQSEPALGLVARFHRGRALEALGRVEEAKAEYRAVAAAWGRSPGVVPGALARERLAALGEP
jgi:serine/threonine-protein kinase